MKIGKSILGAKSPGPPEDSQASISKAARDAGRLFSWAHRNSGYFSLFPFGCRPGWPGRHPCHRGLPEPTQQAPELAASRWADDRSVLSGWPRRPKKEESLGLPLSRRRTWCPYAAPSLGSPGSAWRSGTPASPRAVLVPQHASRCLESSYERCPKSLYEGPVLLLELLAPFEIYRDIGTSGCRFLLRHDQPRSRFAR